MAFESPGSSRIFMTRNFLQPGGHTFQGMDLAMSPGDRFDFFKMLLIWRQVSYLSAS